MEELKNINVEEPVVEMAEVVTEKLTFKENLAAYSLAGIFAIGVVATGYLGYKVSSKIMDKIMAKKERKVIIDEEPATVENNDDEDDDNEEDSE